MAYRKILLVEGQDDMHVLRHICDNRGIPCPDEVRPYDGVSDLLENIPDQIRTSTGEGDVVGVVIDADADLAARWQSICDRLVYAGYPDVPAQPDHGGTILEPLDGSPLPKVGVWIMPDNRNPGILENFLRFLVPQSDALFDHATDCVNSIPNPPFSQNDVPKAVMHTWLAWQEDPGRPYGTSITARFLNHKVPEVDTLIDWLERLFSRQEMTP